MVEDESLTLEAVLCGSSRHCLISVGQKKSHFERVLWHWSSLCQLTWLNLESTGPNGPGGCNVPIDLAKILVKEPVHMGLYYTKILEKVAKCRPSVFGYGDTFVNDCWRLHGAASPARPPILLVFSVRYLVNLNQKSRDAAKWLAWSLMSFPYSSQYNDVVILKSFPHQRPIWRESNGGFLSQGPVTRIFEVCFVVGLNKLNKLSSYRWFEAQLHSCNVTVMKPLVSWKVPV